MTSGIFQPKGGWLRVIMMIKMMALIRIMVMINRSNDGGFDNVKKAPIAILSNYNENYNSDNDSNHMMIIMMMKVILTTLIMIMTIILMTISLIITSSSIIVIKMMIMMPEKDHYKQIRFID